MRDIKAYFFDNQYRIDFVILILRFSLLCLDELTKVGTGFMEIILTKDKRNFMLKL